VPNEREDRIHGPYKHGARWRVVIVAANGTRSHPRESEGGPSGFATCEAADAYISGWRGEGDRTVAAAVDAYVADRLAHGEKARTMSTVAYRLRGLLNTTGRDRWLRLLTPAVAKELLESRRTKRGGKPATETQIGELAAARGFAAWCIAQGWLPRDPFAGLAATGERGRGKAQLRISEARTYVEHALDEDDELDPAERARPGLAAAITLLMGLRASEVTDRVVRDVDDGARVLWIERAKTRKGDRHLEVPEVLRPRLAALVAGRDGGEPLWGDADVDRHWLGYHVRRLCDAAKVPVVCPQALRGTQSSIAARAVPVEHVAEALGQTGPAVTRRHYLARGAEQDGRQRAALRALTGGRR